MTDRQSRVSENDNDSRYAPHDRQLNSRAQPWKYYQHYGSSGRANNAPPRNGGPTSHYHYHHRTENTVDHVETCQAVGGASSDNKQRGYSHYSADCSASNSNARQRNTVADSRNELFDASTERDDASRRGEDEYEARHRIQTRKLRCQRRAQQLSLCIQHRQLFSRQQQPQWRPSPSWHGKRCNSRQEC